MTEQELIEVFAGLIHLNELNSTKKEVTLNDVIDELERQYANTNWRVEIQKALTNSRRRFPLDD